MFFLSKLISKIISKIVNLLKLGSGYTLPGYIVHKIYPAVLTDPQIVFSKGIILVSGTNGKTTTSLLITHLLENSGYKVVHNKSGSNLVRGVLTAILLAFPLFKKSTYDFGVFEVDEFSLPDVLKQLSLTKNPIYLVLLNLSRDQLDRYGETDIIFERWLTTLTNIKNPPKLIVYNTDQQEFNAIVGLSIPCDSFDANDSFLKKTKLFGLYNAYNVNAAVTLCTKLGISLDALSSFEVAYGRGEIVSLKDGRVFKIILAKNPASFNANLQVLLTDGFSKHSATLFVLNDNIPDGRDVSWIYDIDPVLLAYVCEGKKIYVSGTRCLDMVVRLQYAGVLVSQNDIFDNLEKCLQSINEKEILVLPNYSAMLQVRKLLTGRAIL